MEIDDWKAYFAGKVASTLVFVPSLFYTISDSLFHLDDLIYDKPGGLTIVRDLFFLTLSTASYITCNDLYHQALSKSKTSENKSRAESENFQLKEITEGSTDILDEKILEGASKSYELKKDAASEKKPQAKFEDFQLEELTEDITETDDTKLPEDLYELGKTANAKNDFKSAENYFMKATELQPKKAHYWHALTVARFNLQKYELAKNSISVAINYDDKRAKYYSLAGKIYTELRNMEKANLAFDLAKKLKESKK